MPCTEIATTHTLAFLARYLPAAPARILEVGCGRGEVAAALAALGHQVDAIDLDADAVAAAQALGAAFLAIEERRIASGHVRPIGLRMVASAPR